MTTAIRDARAASVQWRRAGIASRLAANAVDAVTFELLYFFALVAIALWRYMLGNEPFVLPDPGPGITLGTQGLFLIVYLTAGWAGAGQTLGKSLLGLRVVRAADGGSLSVARAAVRAATAVFVPIGLALVVVSRRNAALHDLLWRTAVVHDWSGRA